MQELLFDIHTHTKPDGKTYAIQNLAGNFDCLSEKCTYSAGLHPWFIKEEDFEIDFLKLKDAASLPNVVAIGECGLDKVCGSSFELQAKAFERQIILANETGKPLIIHCVRAFGEVVNLLKQNNNKVPVVFHGFNKNATLAKQLIDNGFYLSFGEALLNTAMKDVFYSVPLENFLLETDKSFFDIERIYSQACTIKNIDLNSLSLQIMKNAKKVFGKHFFEL
ncbi:MAG TPA: TatD family hydrolase [Bacteroidia bacterium]|nr:TatD family hydrolase [Bacteroidia bacterium]HNU33142.1 TatD family hydrolase [Bacteroidia bacterium]